jgi:hypothetical protein
MTDNLSRGKLRLSQPSPLSTQHSALSTQHIILTTLFLFALLATVHVLSAQSDDNTVRRTWQVFLQRNLQGSSEDRLTFVDVWTGDENRVTVSGERYTIAGDSVMYYDPGRNQVMIAVPDERPRPHPFIQPGPTTHRVDWLVSADGTRLVWTLTTRDGNSSALSTTTTIANLDGTDPQQVLLDGPRDGIRVLPVAFKSDNRVLYLDYQPDGMSAFTTYPQYAGLFALDLDSGESEFLPGEPGCFCGAGIGAGLFVRLTLGRRGFDVVVRDLNAGIESTAAALNLTGFTQAGDVVIAPDGSYAVYALSQIPDFAAEDQSKETVIILVDLSTMTQTTLSEPLENPLHPTGWTGDNSAILLTSPERDGTWKIGLDDGELTRVAEATYLGLVHTTP